MTQVLYFRGEGGTVIGGVEHRVTFAEWSSRFSVWYDRQGMPDSAERIDRNHRAYAVTDAQWTRILQSCRLKVTGV